MRKRRHQPAKLRKRSPETRRSCSYEMLEARHLLAGLLGAESQAGWIVDPFAADAVTFKQMVDRAATTKYIAGELVVAIESQVQQGPNAIASLNWEALTGVEGTQAVKTLMTVDRGNQRTVSLIQIRLGEDADLFQAMRQLDGFRRVMWSSPNFASFDDPREFVPNDPDYPNQYHHAVMQNDLAWDVTLGSSNIIIGVTDDGVAYDHSDLASNMWKNLADFPLDGIDNDGNGYIDDYEGWDFASNDWNPYPNSPSDTHGTHVAGIAAGRTNNGVGIAGTAGGSRIMALQFYNGGAWTAAMINETFTYAADNGAHIVNTSYNIDGWVGDPVFTAGLQYLYDAGVLHFNSAGNSGALNPARQAFEQTLLVASTEANDTISSFSNYGIGVDLAAPGGSILSTVTNNGYDTFSGTSMAAPNAAGAAALIWSANPGWNRDQVAAQLFATADNIDSLNPTKAGMVGGGRVNSFNGVTATVGAPTVKFVTDLPGDGGYLDDLTIDQFTVAFDQIMDPASVNTAANFELRSAGVDELFDTADDVIFTLGTTTYRIGTNQLVFDILEGPLDYGQYRLRMVSGGLQNPFGTALDGDGNGTGGDDYVSEFFISPPPLGVVAFDQSTYQLEDTITITVSDSNAVAPISVEVTTSGGDTETVQLVAQGFGKFVGTIDTTAGGANNGDGLLQVGLGHDLTVVYQDADDGNGNPATAQDDAFISNIRQYDSDDVPVAIGDNATFTSVIQVNDLGIVNDVNVLLDITHTWASDLDVFLIAPDGTRVELFTDVGGSGDNFTQTTLDDEAAQSILEGVAPFTGSFRPEGNLGDLDGLVITGEWTLEVSDDAGGDQGTLNAWSLFIDVGTLELGVVSTDRPTYAISDTIDISVRDSNAVGPVSVEVYSTRGDLEIVTLTDMGNGTFTGSIDTTAGSANSGDGLLQVEQADGITVKYVDENDGSGNVVFVYAHANIGNVVEYPSSDVPISIGDNATFTSEIVITDGGTVADIDVQLDITHTWVSDLDVFLIAPDGTRIELFQDIGGSGDNFTGTYLDDEAAQSITQGTAPFTGFYRPVGSLSAADGLPIAGTWTLEVSDDAGGDQGTLNAWSLFIDVIPDVVVPDIEVADVASAILEGNSGSTMAEFVVTLSEPTSRAVFVDYQTTNNGMVHAARPGQDYTHVAGTLIFLPGEVSKTVMVEVAGDRIMENHEQFGLQLSNGDGGAIVDSLGMAQITDDETWTSGKPFDFGPYDSPVQFNSVGMMDMEYSADRGMGWTSGASTLQFADRGVGTDLRRDVLIVQDATFEIDADTRRYVVTVIVGDPDVANDNLRIWIEDQPVGLVSTAAGSYYVGRYDTRAFDGRITVRLEDMGGASNRSSVAGLVVQLATRDRGGDGGEWYIRGGDEDRGSKDNGPLKPSFMVAPSGQTSRLALAGSVGAASFRASPSFVEDRPVGRVDQIQEISIDLINDIADEVFAF